MSERRTQRAILVLLTLLLGTLGAVVYARGARAEQRREIVLDHRIEDVWAVVTDYERFGEIFDSWLWDLRVDRVDRSTKDIVHLQGSVTSRIGSAPIDVHVRHETSDGRRAASWNEPAGRVTRNRGSWALEALDGGRTRATYTIEVTCEPYPQFLVNNVLRNQLDPILSSVKRRLEARAAK